MIFLQIAVVVTTLCLASCARAPEPRATGPLRQEAYVWQRDWGGRVQTAVGEGSSRLDGLTLLAAEVGWHDGRPEVLRIPIPYAALPKSTRSIGLALRIGAFHGPFRADDATATLLCNLAVAILDEARAAGMASAELQLDFDCAESRLDGYRLWLEAVKRRVAPTPVSITVLPSWLDRPAFQRLARCGGSYVLQVHSLRRPANAKDPFTLCNPREAREAVERAASFGVPFRVALPTYGYRLDFDPDGQFAGIAADGADDGNPHATLSREIRSDPIVLAGLVRDWMRDRPALMSGLIWYRLPVADDRRNWRWATLARVMAGLPPRGHLRAEPRYPQSGLVELDLLNDGNADVSTRFDLDVRWDHGTLIAADGFHGFELARRTAESCELQSPKGADFLPPGERRTIGWLRLNTNTEVRCELFSRLL
jgi:hypothetical protein